MKSLTPEFLNHIRSGATTLAFCWRLSLTDGRVFGFTTHDQPLTIEGVVYESENAIAPSAYAQDLSLSADDVELTTLFNHDQITERDLLGGRLDGATFLYFLVNWQSLPSSLSATPNNFLELSAGRLGGYSADLRGFKASGLSLIDKLAEKRGIQTSPVCRATLGDSQCKVDLTQYRQDAAVVSSPDGRVITLSPINKPDGYFSNGTIEFLSGAAAQSSAKIASWSNSLNRIELFLPLFYEVAAGDQVRLTAGCDKRFSTCRDRFANQLNNRSEPRLPGQDSIISGVPNQDDSADEVH